MIIAQKVFSQFILIMTNNAQELDNTGATIQWKIFRQNVTVMFWFNLREIEFCRNRFTGNIRKWARNRLFIQYCVCDGLFDSTYSMDEYKDGNWEGWSSHFNPPSLCWWNARLFSTRHFAVMEWVESSRISCHSQSSLKKSCHVHDQHWLQTLVKIKCPIH